MKTEFNAANPAKNNPPAINHVTMQTILSARSPRYNITIFNANAVSIAINVSLYWNLSYTNPQNIRTTPLQIEIRPTNVAAVSAWI